MRTAARLADAGAAETSDLIPAPIITRDVASMRRYLVVSRGRRHGIRVGTPAFAPDGLVGLVVAAGSHQSLVQTILDPESRVAARLPRSGAMGLVRADRTGRNRLEFIEHDADVTPGDTVVTSGLGGMFPRGIAIGVVTAAEGRPAELFRHVELEPFTDFARLDFVFLFRVPSGLPDTAVTPWLENLQPLEVSIPETGR